MSMRTVPLSSGLDWAVRLPAGYPLFFMAALLLSIGAAALITAVSVVMLPPRVAGARPRIGDAARVSSSPDASVLHRP